MAEAAPPPPGAAGDRPPRGAGQGVPVARGPARGAPALGLLPGPAAFRGPAGFRGALAAPGAQRGEVPEQLRAALPGAGGLLPDHLPSAPPRPRGFRRGRGGREGAGPGGATGVTGSGAQPRPPAGRGRRGFPAPVLAGGGGVGRVLGAGSRPGVFGVARGVSGAGPARAGDGAGVTQNHPNSPQKRDWDP